MELSFFSFDSDDSLVSNRSSYEPKIRSDPITIDSISNDFAKYRRNKTLDEVFHIVSLKDGRFIVMFNHGINDKFSAVGNVLVPEKIHETTKQAIATWVRDKTKIY
jgi:hypothetical protein